VPRSRAATVLDWLALTLVIVAAVIALTGGTVIRLGGARITARSPERALLAAIAVIALRVAIDRRTRPLANATALAARTRHRLYDPGLDQPDLKRSWRLEGLAAIGYCAFAAVLLFPQLQRMDSVPDLGDPLLSMWRTGWVFHKLGGDPRPLFSPNIFYPHELTLTYSDSMLLPALTTAPFLLAGVHPVIAYNVVMVLSFIASAFAMYLLAAYLTGTRMPAFIAGLLFGFYPYRFEHYSHFELQMTYCMPLALLALHRFAATRRARYAIAFGLLAVAQLYSSMYYAVFFTIYVAALFLCLCVLTRPPLRKMIAPGLIAGTMALAQALPLARTYSKAQLGDRGVDTVSYYSATTADYLRAHPRSATWGNRGLPGRMPERALFPGIVILLLAAAGLIPRFGATRAAYLVALVVAFEMSRGFNSPFYPFLYDWLAFVRGLRVPARASVLVGMTLALFAAFGVRRLVSARPPWLQRVALGVIVCAVAIDLRPILRLEPVWLEPPPIYGPVAGSLNVVLAEFPFGGNPTRFTPNAPFMYFSLWHWASMLNGYSGHSPPGQADVEQALRGFPDATAVAMLRAQGATHVTVNCALYRGGCDELLSTVDASPAFRLVSAGKWQGASVRLYALVP
jgi:hypothetical protein